MSEGEEIKREYRRIELKRYYCYCLEKDFVFGFSFRANCVDKQRRIIGSWFGCVRGGWGVEWGEGVGYDDALLVDNHKDTERMVMFCLLYLLRLLRSNVVYIVPRQLLNLARSLSEFSRR